MSTPTNQTRSTDPHPRSFFAFGLNLIERLLADEPPPLWLGPVTTAGMDAELASYYERHNPLLASVEGALRENIIDSLRSMGVPEARLADPNDPQVASFVNTCLAGQRLALDAIEARNKSAPSPLLKIKTNWLVVGALCSSLAAKMPEASANAVRNRAADILNDGIPRYDSLVRGITRDHVIRNERSFKAALLARGRAVAARVGKERALELTAAYALHAINQVEQACTIYDEARARPEFAALHGIELADAICARHDVFTCFTRAERVLNRQRAA